MTEREFCYWLQGYFEIDDNDNVRTCNGELTRNQVQCIKDHLALVFNKQTQSRKLSSFEELCQKEDPGHVIFNWDSSIWPSC